MREKQEGEAVGRSRMEKQEEEKQDGEAGRSMREK